MSNTILEEKEKQVCSCGRAYSHCKFCGSRNVYAKKFRSLEMSDIIGKRVYVFGCRRCMSESLSEGQECKALPVREFTPEFNTEIKPVKAHTKPWGNLTPGSAEYLRLFCEEASNIRDKKHVDIHEAYAQLIKNGWPLAVEDMTEELREYLKSKGLLDSKDAGATDNSVITQSGETEQRIPKLAEAESTDQASLEDIIKAMNEEQK